MSQQIHVVHMTTVHSASDTRIFHKECRSLAAASFRVTLLAPGGESGHRDGVDVIAIGQPKQRLSRLLVSGVAVLTTALRLNADIYHFHDPELLWAGILMRALGRRVVYDSHEDLAGQLRTKKWVPTPLRPVIARLTRAVEMVSSRIMSGIVVANPKQAYPFPSGKTVIVQNFALAEEVPSVDAERRSSRPARALYVGGLSEIRGLFQMVRAIELANRTAEVKLVLGGRFDSEFVRAQAEALPGWKYAEYLGELDRPNVVEQLMQATLGLVVVHPVPNYLNNQPVKLFEYMLACIPVVASNIENYRQFVEKHQCGLMVDPLDPESIADAILWLLDHPAEAEAMARRGRAVALKDYTWESQAATLIDFYRSQVLK